MQKFHLQPGEKLLVNDPWVRWVPGGLNPVKGQLKLTDKRLVFVKNANEFAGPLKWFVKSLRSHVLFEIPLSEIKSYSRFKLGENERLTIETNFERPKNFETSKVEVLAAELKRLTGKE